MSAMSCRRTVSCPSSTNTGDTSVESGGSPSCDLSEERRRGLDAGAGSTISSALGRDQFPHTLYEFSGDSLWQSALHEHFHVRLDRVGEPDLLLCEDPREDGDGSSPDEVAVPIDEWISDLNR